MAFFAPWIGSRAETATILGMPFPNQPNAVSRPPASGDPVTQISPPSRANVVVSFTATGQHTPVSLDRLVTFLGGKHPQVWLFDGMTGNGSSIYQATDRRFHEPLPEDLTGGYIVTHLPGPFGESLKLRVSQPIEWQLASSKTLTKQDVTSGLSLLKKLCIAMPGDGWHFVQGMATAKYCARGIPFDAPPLLALNGLTIDDTGRLSSSNGAYPPGFSANRYVSRGLFGFNKPHRNEQRFQSDTINFFRQISAEEILGKFFNPLALQVAHHTRGALRDALASLEPGFQAKFASCIGAEPGGAVGVGAIKVAPGTLALVAWGDSEIGFARNGKVAWIYGGIPEYLRHFNGLLDFAGIHKSGTQYAGVQAPSGIDVRILHREEIEDAVIFGFTDGCYRANQLSDLIAKLDGHLHSPEAIINRFKEIDPWIVDQTSGRSGPDDRTAFAVRALDLL